MTLWALVPVKPLRRGKSRLKEVLTEEERTELNINMLINTVKILGEIPELSNVLIVSRDPKALSVAREYGARTVQEDGNPELNIALTRATLLAQSSGAKGVFILPADLPLITKEDIYTMIDHAIDPPVVVIAPDHKGTGTNALIVYPAGLMKYEFGINSFQKHTKQARVKGLNLQICELPSIALDIDEPEDLSLLNGFEFNKIKKVITKN